MEINKQDIEKEREIIKDLQQQLAELKKEKETLIRALRLSCIEHKTFGYCCYCDDNCDKTELTCEECLSEYFIDQIEQGEK